jgi:predicted CXXCH cytochrome family protein
MRTVNSPLAIWLLLLALLAACATWIFAAPRGGFHPAGMPCEGCHLAGKVVKPEQAHLLVANQEKLCGTCHKASTQVSHPSGFTPSGKPHADYPLDWKGDLTCSTCHDVHSMNPGLMRGTRRGRDLCLSCHDAKFFASMRDRGAAMMATSHLNAGTSEQGEKLDVYSRQCMECHGEKGTDRSPTVVRNMVIRHGTSSLNHPVGANYATAVKFGGYRPVARLSKKVLLVGGLVSCVSCHEGYSKSHGKLVITGASSQLCFECHDL